MKSQPPSDLTMGVRLHPQTENRDLIEILAGVPAGTYDKLDQFEADNPTDLMDQDQSYAVYQKRQRQPNIDRLHNFLMFGYGRIDAFQMRNMGFDPNGGRTRNLVDICRILTAHVEIGELRRIWPHLYKLEALAWC